MKLSRRGWNNVLIAGIILFILALNLPNVIKSHWQEQQVPSPYPYLLNPELEVLQIDFAKWSLQKEGDTWRATHSLSIPAPELMQRWQQLVGTEVSESTYNQLKSGLPSARSIEVWYIGQEEPQRITYYQTPKFWLMQNWQQQWIAISVAPDYLFPLL
jgi:hypothetical protein